MKTAFAAILVASLAAAKQKDGAKRMRDDELQAQQILYDLVTGWAVPADEADLIDLGSSDIEEAQEEMNPWKDFREEYGKGRGISAKRIYAAGRAYDDYDSENGWSGSWKDFKDDIGALEDTNEWTPEQWFLAGREFVPAVEEEVIEEPVLESSDIEAEMEKAEKEMSQRRLFNQERKTYRQTKPKWAEYMEENEDEGLMAARDGYEGEGRWWKDSDLDLDSYRDSFRQSRSDWRDGTPSWEDWSSE